MNIKHSELKEAIKTIKEGYEYLGITYSRDDLIDVLVSYYGLSTRDIEDLKL
jgi:hypothetical protein